MRVLLWTLRLVRTGLWAIVAALAASCGGGGGSSQESQDKSVQYATFAGNWRGTLVEATTGSFGEAALTLQQTGATLSGTWNAQFNSGTVNGGTITGSVLGNVSSAHFQLTAYVGGCPLSVTVALLTGEAQGTYASVDCPVLSTGTVHVYQDGGPIPYSPPSPAQPQGLVATPGNGQVTLRWTRVPGASAHNVYWSADPAFTTGTGKKEARVTEPATITLPSNGTPYYFIVTAENASGEGPASAQVDAIPLDAAPNAPSGVVAAPGVGQVTVTWPGIGGAVGYNLYWSTTAGQAIDGTKVTGATSPHTLTGLANGTTYFIAVTAINASGESAPSPEARATPYSSTPYDFDSGTLQGWIPSGSWAAVTSKAHSVAYSATDSPGGNYPNNADSWLQSQAIELAGSASPVLTFWHQHALETGYDWAQVEVSSNSGASWTVLKRFTGTQSAWTAETISLEAYSGSSVLIRFRVTTDGSVTSDGWYVDDVVISR